jgi:hypothetical protein
MDMAENDNYGTPIKTPEQKKAFDILTESYGINLDDIQIGDVTGATPQEEVEGGTWVTFRLWVPKE